MLSRLKWLLSGIAAALVASGAILNIKPVYFGCKSEYPGIKNLPHRIHTLISKDFSFKDPLLTLNGGFARVLCMRRCNDVYKLPNGHLIRPFPRSSQKWRAEKIASLSRAISESGSKFVFVLFPNKIVCGEKMMPDGWAPGNDALYDNADELVARLGELGVDVIDTRKAVCATQAAINENFFKTDHHWNAIGAFRGFRFLTEELIYRLTGSGDLAATLPSLNLENWDKLGLNRRVPVFLGSNGRRTGPWFAGYDYNFVYIVPKFKQHYEHKFKSRGWQKLMVKKGSFVDTMVAEKVVGECGSCYKDMGYSVYYTDLAESSRHCADAPVRARIMVVKDSYAIPVLAFMSTVFSDVFAIDLRYDPMGKVMNSAEEFRPDIVMMMYNPSSFLSEENKLWIW